MWLCLLSIVLLLSNEAEGDKLNAVEGETYNLQLYVYDNSFCNFVILIRSNKVLNFTKCAIV